MVTKKLSRVINMNYTYTIQISPLGLPVVKEQKNGENPDLWSLGTLLDPTWNKSDAPSIKSLVRTKKWLKAKHPEIIMKFLIFEDGVYDRNDVPMAFWKFSELNKMFIDEKNSNIISFKRTKDWIIENHPELLI